MGRTSSRYEEITNNEIGTAMKKIILVIYDSSIENDVLKVDGNNVIAWSGSLEFTVERSGKSLIGSAASGEGLVNVYRGTGKVLLAPVDSTIGGFPVSSTAPSAPASAGSKTAGALGSLLGGIADALD